MLDLGPSAPIYVQDKSAALSALLLRKSPLEAKSALPTALGAWIATTAMSLEESDAEQCEVSPVLEYVVPTASSVVPYSDVRDDDSREFACGWTLVPESAFYGSSSPSRALLTHRLARYVNESVLRADRALQHDLTEALRDLANVPDEAEEKQAPKPSSATLMNAEILLRRMYRMHPIRYSVYPLYDGEVAIDATRPNGESVIVVCLPDGGAICLVGIGLRQRRARYSDMESLPDGFFRDALLELAESSIPIRCP